MMQLPQADLFRDEPPEVEIEALCAELHGLLTAGQWCGYVVETGVYLYNDKGKPIGFRGTARERETWQRLQGLDVPVPRFRPARQITWKGVRDRGMGISTVAAHIKGSTRVAYRSPRKAQALCIDLDCHLAPGEAERPEIVSERFRDRDERLAQVVRILRAMDCEPVVSRSPNHGYHVWLRLDRPMERARARRLLRVVLIHGGYEIRETDIYPSERGIRVPAGVKQIVIDPDTLGPVPGAARGTLRDIVGNLRAFVERFRHAVLPIATLERWVDKAARLAQYEAYQPASGTIEAQPADTGHEFSGRGRVRKGRAFWDYVQELLAHGLTRTGQRWDAVMTLAFYWLVTCGASRSRARFNLCEWMRSHSHVTASADFIGESLGNFDSYAEHLERGLHDGSLTPGSLDPSSARNLCKCDPIKASRAAATRWAWELEWKACLQRWLEWLFPRHGQVVAIPRKRGKVGNGAWQIGGKTSYTIPDQYTPAGHKARNFVSWAVMDKLREIGVLVRVGGHRHATNDSGSHGALYHVDLAVLEALLNPHVLTRAGTPPRDIMPPRAPSPPSETRPPLASALRLSLPVVRGTTPSVPGEHHDAHAPEQIRASESVTAPGGRGRPRQVDFRGVASEPDQAPRFARAGEPGHPEQAERPPPDPGRAQIREHESVTPVECANSNAPPSVSDFRSDTRPSPVDQERPPSDVLPPDIEELLALLPAGSLREQIRSTWQDWLQREEPGDSS